MFCCFCHGLRRIFSQDAAVLVAEELRGGEPLRNFTPGSYGAIEGKSGASLFSL